MEVNLTQMLDPWDFAITVGEVTYPTRPLTVADLAFIDEIKGQDIAAVLNRAKQFIESLFVGDAPQFHGCTHEWVVILLAKLMEYIDQRAKKNAGVLRAAGEAIKAPSNAAPAPSSPPSADAIPAQTP